MPIFRGDALRVELQPVNRTRDMPQPHNLAVLCPSIGDKGLGQALALHREAVVARGVKGRTETREKPRIVMMYRRDLAMHDVFGADDPAAKSLADRLLPQTYA